MSELRFPRRVATLRERLAAPETKTNDENNSVEIVAPPVDALIVSHGENVGYLSGFSGSNGLAIITPTDALFLTDGRYALQSAVEVPGWTRTILPQGASLAHAAGQAIKELNVASVGFEAEHLSFDAYAALAKALPANVALVARSESVESVRAIKDTDEVTRLRAAMVIADDCFEYLQTIARPGRTEREVAWDIEVFMRHTRGADRLSFASIVGSGPNSALIHGRPSERRLGVSNEPEFLLCDYGCEQDGYCSDITRTLVIGGEPTGRMREVYEAVRAVQQAALDAIRPGVKGRDVHQAASKMLADAGWGELQHGLGHGLGRVVHDGRAFGQTSTVTLAPGMVVTVEPGAYLEGLGGVRIEDDVLVTETGCEVLTQSPKELIVIT